jgi:D-glycero-D-manno-heptose 1,7-bisphosphate phosphatase
MAANRALILDRDGVINMDRDYVHRPDQCEFLDGIFPLMRAFAARGFRLAIATNQAGIGRGYYSEADFHAFMEWMKDVFRREGIEIAAIYHCPDHPTAGLGAYKCENSWRKPGPGMMLQAVKDLALDAAASWCLGDKATDMEAARAAGIGTLVLLEPQAVSLVQRGDVWHAPRLDSVVQLLTLRDGNAR